MVNASICICFKVRTVIIGIVSLQSDFEYTHTFCNDKKSFNGWTPVLYGEQNPHIHTRHHYFLAQCNFNWVLLGRRSSPGDVVSTPYPLPPIKPPFKHRFQA